MNDKVKNMIVGLFVTVAIALIVGIVLFIQPGSGDGGQTLNVRFSNINGLGVGTRVLYAGKPIGEVSKIEMIPNARNQPVDQLGQLYTYQLVLKVDSKAKIYTTDNITIATSGLLGEKSIAIIPKLPPKGVHPQLVTAKTPLYGDSVDGFQEAFHEISNLAEGMQTTIDKVNTWIDDNGYALGKAIRSFDGAMEESAQFMKELNEQHVVASAKQMIDAIGSTFDDIAGVIEEMNHDGAFTNLSASLRNFRAVTENLAVVTDEIAEGRGTIGRLLMSDEFYLEVNAVITKIETLMNDINNYGILFNYNKEWQRQRLSRANLMNALDTPQKFKAYFQEEVDSINAAMSRLSMLIKRADESPQKEHVLDSSLFHKDFAELLRLVNQMLGNLKLYNERLQQATEEMCR